MRWHNTDPVQYAVATRASCHRVTFSNQPCNPVLGVFGTGMLQAAEDAHPTACLGLQNRRRAAGNVLPQV